MSDDIKQELLESRPIAAGVLRRGGTYVLGLGGGSSFEGREVMAAFLQGILLPLVVEGAYYPSPAVRDATRALYPYLMPLDTAEVQHVLALYGVIVAEFTDLSPLRHVRPLDLRVVAARPREYFCYPLVTFCSRNFDVDDA